MIINKFDDNTTIYTSSAFDSTSQTNTLLNILEKNIVIITNDEYFDENTLNELIKPQV